METLRYKDILICPAPTIYVEKGKEYWSGDFSIECSEGARVTATRHGTGKLYETKDDALNDIFNLAKLIIDRRNEEG